MSEYTKTTEWLSSILCDISSSASKESACNAGDLGSIPGLGRSPRKGNSYPLEYSGLENSKDCIVHGITKSQTQLDSFHYHLYLELFLFLKINFFFSY